MADPKRVGRVFCVTGVNQDESLAFITNEEENNTCHSDTESNSSGYSSSSSVEYSGEEKRQLPNDRKVFQMWEQLKQHAQEPKCSTPKQSRAVRRVTSSTKNLLAIRKTLGKSRVSQQSDSKMNTNNIDNDSFWDIELPERKNACSASSDMPNTTCERPRSVPLSTSHEAGSEIPSTRRSSGGDRKTTCQVTSNTWRRRPYLTLSNSDSDLRKCRKASQHSGSSSDSNISKYNCLPRYRVKVESDTEVDESMSEFISSVDKDNLAGILQFYDHITSESAYRQKQKSPYESVFF